MAGDVAALLHALRESGLPDRDDRIAQIEALAQSGKLSDAMARVMYHQLLPEIERAIDFPSFLHRPPPREALLANGPPDIEFLTLVEGDEELRYGIKLTDRPRHLIAVGGTGSGKTTALRCIGIRVHEYNERHPDRPICVIIFEFKEGDFADFGRMLGPRWCHVRADRDLRVGLNPPRGMAVLHWGNLVSSILGARAGLISSRATHSAIYRCERRLKSAAGGGRTARRLPYRYPASRRLSSSPTSRCRSRSFSPRAAV